MLLSDQVSEQKYEAYWVKSHRLSLKYTNLMRRSRFQEPAAVLKRCCFKPPEGFLKYFQGTVVKTPPNSIKNLIHNRTTTEK